MRDTSGRFASMPRTVKFCNNIRRQPVGLALPQIRAAQPAKVAPFAGANGADVRLIQQMDKAAEGLFFQ